MWLGRCWCEKGAGTQMWIENWLQYVALGPTGGKLALGKLNAPHWCLPLAQDKSWLLTLKSLKT